MQGAETGVGGVQPQGAITVLTSGVTPRPHGPQPAYIVLKSLLLFLQVLPAVYLFVGRSLNATPVQLGTLTLCRAMVQVSTSRMVSATASNINSCKAVSVYALHLCQLLTAVRACTPGSGPPGVSSMRPQRPPSSCHVCFCCSTWRAPADACLSSEWHPR